MKKWLMLSIFVSTLLFAQEKVKIAIINFNENQEYSKEYSFEKIKEYYSKTTLSKTQIESVINNLKNFLIEEGAEIITESQLKEEFKTFLSNINKCVNMICINDFIGKSKQIYIVNIIPLFSKSSNYNNIILNAPTQRGDASIYININDVNKINYSIINKNVLRLIFGDEYMDKPYWFNLKEGFYEEKEKIFKTIGYSSNVGDKDTTLRNAVMNANVNFSKFINTTVSYSKKDNTEVTEIKSKIKISGNKITDIWMSINGEAYVLFEISVDDILKSNSDIPSSFFDNAEIIDN